MIEKTAIGLILSLVLLLLLIVLRGAYAPYTVRMAELDEEIARYRPFADAEADYILRCRVESGAVLVYERSSTGHGYVNPYFACQAMLGLLSEPDSTRLEAVERYLCWHTATLLAQEGRITDFDYTDGELVPKEPDSVDAYAGKYLTLLAAFARSGGDLNAVSGWKEAAALLMDVLDSLTLNGCVYVNDDFRVAYLMDNAEVYQGCRAAAELLKRYSGNRSGDAALAERYTGLADKIRTTVESRFWDAENLSYHIGLSGSGDPVRFESFEEFYPDCIAQLYPVITGMTDIGSRERMLYAAVCSHHAWESGQIEDSTFEWSVMAYAACLFGDVERLDSYLEYYTERAEASRKYPMHTSNAGWVMEACSLRLTELREERNGGFLRYLLSRATGKNK